MLVTSISDSVAVSATFGSTGTSAFSSTATEGGTGGVAAVVTVIVSTTTSSSFVVTVVRFCSLFDANDNCGTRLFFVDGAAVAAAKTSGPASVAGAGAVAVVTVFVAVATGDASVAGDVDGAAATDDGIGATTAGVGGTLSTIPSVSTGSMISLLFSSTVAVPTL